MKKFQTDLKQAKSIAPHPTLWAKARPPIGAMAKLICMYHCFVNEEPIEKHIDKIDFPPLPLETALAVLSTLHDWWGYSDKEMKKTSSTIRVVLKRYLQTVPRITDHQIISSRIILNANEANLIIQRMLERDELKKKRGPYDLGLLKSLSRWSEYRAHGLIKPDELRTIRKAPPLQYTQEQMARALGMTLRQYTKYEAGTCPIPDDKAYKIRGMIKKGGCSTSPAPTPKIALYDPLAPYNYYVGG